MSCVRGPRYFRSNGQKKLTHDDFNIIYGLSLAKILAYTGHTFVEFPFLDRILETADDGEDVSIVGVCLT